MLNNTCMLIDSSESFYNTANHFLRNFFICIGVILSGSTFAIKLISYFLFKNIQKEYKSLYGYNSDDEEYFNSKFLNDYFKLHSNADLEDDSEHLNDKIVIEYSPKGFIILGYNTDNKSFYYYSDCKNIEYAYLEVVARKFVITYNCKNLLINSKKEFINILNDKLQKKIFEENKPNNVFANLKSIRKNKLSIDYNLKIKDIEIPVSNNTNKYIYKGTLLDYEQINQPKPSIDYENIDFENFKKL